MLLKWMDVLETETVFKNLMYILENSLNGEFLVTGKIGKLFIMSKGSFRLCSSFSVGAIEIAFLIKLVNRDELVGEVPVRLV